MEEDFFEIVESQLNAVDKLWIDYAKAYADLQLNPEDQDQWSAFETLCWHHIRLHASVDWIRLVHNREIMLTWDVRAEDRSENKREGRETKTLTMYDDTLEDLTHLFVKKYAKEIWPREGKPLHLMPPSRTANLKAGPMEMRARVDYIKRLAQERGVCVTERLSVVESKIGKRVREFFKWLLWARLMPQRVRDDPQYLVLLIRRAVAPKQYHCSHSEYSVVRTTRTAMDMQRNFEYHPPAGEIEIVDLTRDDE